MFVLCTCFVVRSVFCETMTEDKKMYLINGTFSHLTASANQEVIISIPREKPEERRHACPTSCIVHNSVVYDCGFLKLKK